MIPYFQAGLENNEFCMWVTSPPIQSEEAKNTLRRRVPGADRYLAAGDIEIVPHTQWYLKGGTFDLHRVIDGWHEKLTQALAKGYVGMRVNGIEAWLTEKDWKDFAAYEKELNRWMADQHIIVLCTYPLTRTKAGELFDVARTHQFAMAKRNGHWEALETSELRQTKAELITLNQELEQRVADRTKELKAINAELRQEIVNRKHVEEALLKSERALRRLFAAMTDVVLVLDAEGRYLEIAPTNPSNLYRPSEELLGKKIHEILPQEDADQILHQIHQTLKNHQTINFEYKLNIGSKEVWFDSRISPLTANKVFWIARDITDRKRVEAELRKQKEILQKIFDNLPVMISFADQEGHLILVNQAWEHTLGWSLEELQQQGKDIFAEFYPDPEYGQKVLDFVAAAKGEWVEFKMRVKDGRMIDVAWARIKLSDGTSVGIGQDITERKQAEEALRDNEQFLTDIFNSIQDGMIILNPDFTVIRVNPAMEKLPFVQPMVGRKCYEVLHDRSEPCEVCSARQVFQTGQPAEKVLSVKADDGSIIFMEIHAFPLLNRTTGQVDQVIEFSRNITERKRAEEERLRFSKLESMSILAGGIAHDFNNILTTILGNIGLAMLNRKLGEEEMESLVQAEQACFRAQELSGQLLTFAKGGAPIKKVTSLAKLVRESGKLALAGSKSRCEFSIPEDLWSVEADEGQINQVINNLLINADQAMPSGGIIKIEAENITVEEGSDLPLSEGKYVKLTITDQGIGIPSQYLDKIFDPYFTTKQKGSGLGLATAYSIIKNHSGHIKVESQVGVRHHFSYLSPR